MKKEEYSTELQTIGNSDKAVAGFKHPNMDEKFNNDS